MVPESHRIIFVTGTGTGVGKTLFTGLLLCHLRTVGVRAMAMKPFSSGDRGDAEILCALQAGEVGLEEINPYHFRAALAPGAAARKEKRSVRLAAVVRHIQKLSRRCQVLLVEGAGGLMVPLGRGFRVVDLIARLGCEVLVVGRNELGVINHTLLTVGALQHIGVEQVGVALMGSERRDLSSESNAEVLREWLRPSAVFELPFLGKRAMEMGVLKKNSMIFKKTLARFVRAS